MPRIQKRPLSLPDRTVDPRNLLPSKILLVGLRPGEAAADHPEVAPYLDEGWTVKSAVPRIIESKGAGLLVVLTRSETAFSSALASAA